MLTTYSQDKEDIILISNYLDVTRKGNYIELGAHDGVKYSNTKLLEDQYGWTGILIEPNRFIFERLKSNRPNNFLSNALIGPGSFVNYKYFDLQGLAPVSCVEESEHPRHNEKWFSENNKTDWHLNALKNHVYKEKIKETPLSEVVKDSQFSDFSLVSIDVEGHELRVLQSFDFRVNVEYFLIEVLDESTRIVDFMGSHSFSVVDKIGKNILFAQT